MRQSLCQLPHDVTECSLWVFENCFLLSKHNGNLELCCSSILTYDISRACYGETVRHQMLFLHLRIFIQGPKDPWKTRTKNRWLSDVCSLCSDGIQVVSLESFVQGMKTRWAKTGQSWDSFGSDLVGLYWLEFSGCLVLNPFVWWSIFKCKSTKTTTKTKTTIWLPISSWPEPDLRENNSTSDIFQIYKMWSISADDSSWIEGGTREPPEMASPDVAWRKTFGFENGFGSEDDFPNFIAEFKTS